MKLAWQVLRAAHTYLVDHLLACVRTDVMARYVNFVDGLRSSPSMEVRVMCGVAAGDVRSTTGRNLWWLKTESGLDPLRTTSVKMKAVLSSKLAMVPDRDRWRISYLAKLLEERGQVHYEGGDVEQLTVLIDSLCTN